MIRLFNWIDLKPNRFKIIIALILIALTFTSFMYVAYLGLCDGPFCPSQTRLSRILSPVSYIYTPFGILSEFADSILIKHDYINENAHVSESKYPELIEYTIRTILFLIVLSVYLIFFYIVSCLIFKIYKKYKNKQ